MPYIGQQTVQVAAVNAATPEAVNRGLTALANSINTLLGALQSGRLTLGGTKFDTQRTAPPSVGPGPLDPNVLAATDTGGVTTWYGWDGSAWQAFATEAYVDQTPGSVSATPAAPASTTSATPVMMGLAVAFTPVKSPRANISLRGQMANTTVAKTVTVQGYYGTGTAPVNGAAVTGTALGALQTNNSQVAAQLDGFAVGGFVSGLVPTTPYWLDLAVAAPSGGTASTQDLTVDAVECF